MADNIPAFTPTPTADVLPVVNNFGSVYLNNMLAEVVFTPSHFGPPYSFTPPCPPTGSGPVRPNSGYLYPI